MAKWIFNFGSFKAQIKLPHWALESPNKLQKFTNIKSILYHKRVFYYYYKNYLFFLNLTTNSKWLQILACEIFHYFEVSKALCSFYGNKYVRFTIKIWSCKTITWWRKVQGPGFPLVYCFIVVVIIGFVFLFFLGRTINIEI